MCCNFPTIKITEGNAFTLIFPLKRRSYVAEKPIDEDIDVTRLNDVRVTLGGVEYAPTIETYGVRIDVPATLARGTYDGLLTADYDGNAIRGAYESCVQIVAWNAQSNAQQYILGSPVATNAAYVLGYMPTYEEVEALKQQLREQIAAAEHAEAEAIAEKQRYAEAIEHLDGIAKQGDDPEVSLTSLSEIIEGLDISKVAKQGTDITATNTAIRDKVDEIIATIGGEADVNAVYLGLLNRQTDYQAEGFPDQQDLPHLPQAVAAFTPRKINNGGVENDGIPDGISLARLLCSTYASSVTEIVDPSVGWTYNNNFYWSSFPNIKRVVLNCIDHTTDIINAPLEQVELPKLRHSLNGYIIINGALSEEITIPELEDFNGWIDYARKGRGKVFNCPNLRVLRFPKLHTSAKGTPYGDQSNIVGSCPNLEELYMPSFSYIFNAYIVVNCPKLRKVVFGTLKSDFRQAYGDYRNNFTDGSSTNLIHFEIGAGSSTGTGTRGTLHMNWWIPTNALDASRTDLIEEGSTAQNNLQQFLSNFKTYIAERLTDKGTGLTLTLSQEVRNAIHAAEDEYGIENIIITQKGWTISPAPN